MAVEIIVFFLFSIIMSMMGMGGGILYVPMLLFLGYNFHDASTLSLFLISVTGLSAFGHFFKTKLVDWKLVIVMELSTGLGAFTGGFTTIHFNDTYLQTAFGIVLLVAAGFMLRSKNKQSGNDPVKTGRFYWHRRFDNSEYSINILLIIPIMFSIGYIAGILGVSGGVFKVPIMILWFSIPTKIAVATSSLMVSFTGLLGLGGHLLNEPLKWKLALILGITVFTGAKIGSRISVRLPEKSIKRLMSVILSVLAIYMIIKTLI